MSVRFAPSPTGTFHIGNLRTAWISHEFARALAMQWVVRFEDIDKPRVVPGAMERQLEDMRALGLLPDRVLIQSERQDRHEALFRDASARGEVYPCACSRKELQLELQSLASAPHEVSPLYTGRCRNPRNRIRAAHSSLAWRFAIPDDPSGKSDFVIARTAPDGSDFTPSYHWACAIDDFDGGHRLLVRASDLAHAQPLQRRIFDWVAKHEGSTARYPAVFHTALVTSDDGGRLEKRTQRVTLAEILERGMSCAEIVSRFKSSFDPGLMRAFSDGKIWGEPRERVRLGEIGLS